MYYKVSMDAKLVEWAEIDAVVKATNMDEAFNKAEQLNFEDIKIKEVFDTQMTDYDKGEGIKIEPVL